MAGGAAENASRIGGAWLAAGCLGRLVAVCSSQRPSLFSSAEVEAYDEEQQEFLVAVGGAWLVADAWAGWLLCAATSGVCTTAVVGTPWTIGVWHASSAC